MNMESTSSNKAGDEWPAYQRQMAEMQRRFEEATYPDYEARYRALWDEKIAREKAAKEKAAKQAATSSAQQIRSHAPQNSTTVTSDSEDASALLRDFNPRKERVNKGSSRGSSSDGSSRRHQPALPTRVKESASPSRDMHDVPPTRSENASRRSSSSAGRGLATKHSKVRKPAGTNAQPEARPAQRTKRPSDTHPSEDRRPSAPKQARRSSVASPSAVSAVPISRHVGALREPPRWYVEIPRPKQGVRGRNQSNADISIDRLKDLINKAKGKAQKRLVVPSADFDEILERLHTLAFLPVDGPLLKTKRMLDNQNGLPQLFDDEFAGGVQWPWYLKADAEEQYNKWCTRVFETDLYRGIERHNKGGKPDRLTKNEAEHETFRLMDPKQHGNGLLLNGAWWPMQLAALRDGGHGSSQGGIAGGPESGAYSVIMAGGLDPQNQPYPNKDEGDTVLYCGTDNQDKEVAQPSKFTQALITDYERKLPVRLFRSHNLDSPYAPEIGFRYDGLYTIVDYEVMDPPGEKRCRHRFKLVRCAGQDPIRSDGPEKRPTRQEIDEYDKDKKNHGR